MNIFQRKKLNSATSASSYQDYVNVLDLVRNIGSFAKNTKKEIREAIYFAFFLFPIDKLFENPEIFKKMNQLHAEYYLQNEELLSFQGTRGNYK